MIKPRGKCPLCGFDSMSVCRCGIPSLSNERNPIIPSDENKTSNVGMWPSSNIVSIFTGLYKTERPLVDELEPSKARMFPDDDEIPLYYGDADDEIRRLHGVVAEANRYAKSLYDELHEIKPNANPSSPR